MWGDLSDERTGLPFTIAAGPRQCSHSRVESRGTRDHILLSQVRHSPNLEGQVPVFIYPRDRLARLYPQSLGSLIVASYDSQGYSGGIRTRLHEGWIGQLNCLQHNSSARTPSKTQFFYCWARSFPRVSCLKIYCITPFYWCVCCGRYLAATAV
jgi:hypothetical protein